MNCINIKTNFKQNTNKLEKWEIHFILWLFWELEIMTSTYKDLRERTWQYVQNSAACLITHTRKNDHITPILYHLHWLPVSLCINYKMLIVTYKTLHNLGPTYFSDLLLPYVPARSLRSSSEGLLVTSKFRLVTMGSRAFSVVAPRLWNALPQNIRHASSLLSFINLLKIIFSLWVLLFSS